MTNIATLKSSYFIYFILGLVNKKQGPGSIRQSYSGGKCIHVLNGARQRPKEGQFLVIFTGCGKDRLEFQLLPNGTLLHTRHGMCVKPTGPVTGGVKVGKLVLRYISSFEIILEFLLQ